MMHMQALLGLPGYGEWLIIGIVALLVFGKRLPDVARSLGRSIVEFKRGINDIGNDVDRQASKERPKLEDNPRKERTAEPAEPEREEAGARK